MVHKSNEDEDPTTYILRHYSCESTKEVNEALDELVKRGYITSTGFNDYAINKVGMSKSIKFMDDWIDENL